MSKIVRFIVLAAFVIPATTAAADLGPGGKVVVVRVPSGGQAVAAEITTGGAIHLLYNSGDIPYYIKSIDDGASFSSPIAVVNQASRKPGLVFTGMSMAVGQGNAVYVAMITNNWLKKLPKFRRASCTPPSHPAQRHSRQSAA